MAFRSLPRLLATRAPWRLSQNSPLLLYSEVRTNNLIRLLSQHRGAPALLVPTSLHAKQQYRLRNVYSGYAPREGKPLSRKGKLYFLFLGGTMWLVAMTPL